MQTGRNDPCPCGSGKKFKKCCLNKGQPAAVSPAIPPRSPASFLQTSDRAARTVVIPTCYHQTSSQAARSCPGKMGEMLARIQIPRRRGSECRLPPDAR